jgi:hypothetical protein
MDTQLIYRAPAEVRPMPALARAFVCVFRSSFRTFTFMLASHMCRFQDDFKLLLSSSLRLTHIPLAVCRSIKLGAHYLLGLASSFAFTAPLCPYSCYSPCSLRRRWSRRRQNGRPPRRKIFRLRPFHRAKRLRTRDSGPCPSGACGVWNGLAIVVARKSQLEWLTHWHSPCWW